MHRSEKIIETNMKISENQLRTSLGFYSIEFEKSYFDDLSLINTSDDIRKIYKTKLNDMTINKNNYIIEK